MKVLVDLKRETWASVKEYATIRNVNLGKAVDGLLQFSLSQPINPNNGQNKEMGLHEI